MSSKTQKRRSATVIACGGNGWEMSVSRLWHLSWTIITFERLWSLMPLSNALHNHTTRAVFWNNYLDTPPQQQWATPKSFLTGISLNLIIYCSLFIYLFIYLSIYIYIYLSICLSIYLSVYLSICLSVCLSIYIYLSISPSYQSCLYVRPGRWDPNFETLVLKIK